MKRVTGFYVRLRQKHGVYGWGPFESVADAQTWLDLNRLRADVHSIYIEQVSHALRDEQALEFRKEQPLVRPGQ